MYDYLFIGLSIKIHKWIQLNFRLPASPGFVTEWRDLQRDNVRMGDRRDGLARSHHRVHCRLRDVETLPRDDQVTDVHVDGVNGVVWGNVIVSQGPLLDGDRGQDGRAQEVSQNHCLRISLL